MKCTSIIRCKNEEEWIGHAIQSFIDYFPDGEIIIIDNKSTDRSMEIIKLFDRFDISVVKIDDYTPGKALNLGVKYAKYDTVLIQSAHSVIENIDHEVLERNLKNHVAVFGNQTPIYLGKRITKRYIWSHFKQEKTVKNMFSEIENRYFLHNAFCFYRKEIILENLFDEKLHGKEDRYWAANIIKKDYSYLYCPVDLSCRHYYTSNGATWKGLG